MENSKRSNVYSLEASAKKISDALDVLLEEKPKMYEKTKIRYKDIAVSLLSSAEKISKILQDLALSPQSDDEFNELAGNVFDSRIDSALQGVQTEVTAAKSFSSSSNAKTFVDLQLIDDTLQELESLNLHWKEINTCARLLHTWFHLRFIVHPPQVCNYSYIGSWVHAFILSYGKACSDGTAKVFESSLQVWCDQLSQKPLANKYVLPFSIFNITRSDEPADFTVHAVLINDFFYSSCLYKLSSLYSSFDSVEICRTVKGKNPGLIPKLNTRFAKQQELLEFAKFSHI